MARGDVGTSPPKTPRSPQRNAGSSHPISLAIDVIAQQLGFGTGHSMLGSLSGLDSLAESNLVLARSNEVLVERLADHDEVKATNAVLQREVTTLTHEVTVARSDKAALEQEMRLGQMQRSTKRKNILISVVPFALAFGLFVSSIVSIFIIGSAY